ncbi:bifunctional nicotinamidase/pyrazinamidase [uncultured Bartonella sp.]|uniref:bifunctional nicotinamidase/pyrazinamidase n=1 Tax=uncultured Bartonella sp. TaxID=104108 RepID=UPI00261C5CE8|nr:bifunctional nicotinamidase/pyrazinamidase [uncultured Bartonella sp.]
MGKEALVVVDVQNDFLPGGALAVPDGDLILPTVFALMMRFEHVILTQDWHPQSHMSFASNHHGFSAYDSIMVDYGPQTLWPDHCIQGSEGAALHGSLPVDKAELIIRKGTNPQIDSYSAFFENDRKTPTGLRGYLTERGIKNLTFCGLATDFCVAYSALDAKNCGFDVAVALSGCAGLDINGSLDFMLKTMNDTGVKLLMGAI